MNQLQIENQKITLPYFCTDQDINKCFVALTIKYGIRSKLKRWSTAVQSKSEYEDRLKWIKHLNNDQMDPHDIVLFDYIRSYMLSKMYWTKSTWSWVEWKVCEMLGYDT